MTVSSFSSEQQDTDLDATDSKLSEGTIHLGG